MTEDVNETVRASDQEIQDAIKKDMAENAAAKAPPADVVSKSDTEAEEKAFFAEFEEYFSDSDDITLIDDDDKTAYIIRVESMTVLHIRTFKAALNSAIKKFAHEELLFDEETGALNWHSAMPIIINIILDDLLELLIMSCQVVDGEKLTRLTSEQFDTFQHEWLPMLIVPWIQRNFMSPKKRKPWMMAVRGFTMRVLGVGSITSAFQTAFQNSPPADTPLNQSSTEKDQAAD